MKYISAVHQQSSVIERAVFGVCVLVLGVLEFAGVLKPIRTRGEVLIEPLLKIHVQLVQVIASPYRVTKNSLRHYRYVQDLELRYAEAIAQLSDQDTLRRENQELREQLGISTGESTAVLQGSRIFAPIIAYGRPTIALRAAEDVPEGLPVLVAQTLVGKIGRREESSAEIVLLSQRNSTPVLAKTETGVTGIVVGDGKRVVMREIPIEVDVKIGERVVTIGQESIGEGISIGKVQSIEKSQGSPTQTAVIDQGVSFFEVKVIEVRK